MRIDVYDGKSEVFLDAHYPKGKGITPLPAALICPGGGYQVIGTSEGRPTADRFNAAGYAAFILHYRVGREAWVDTGGSAVASYEFAPPLDLAAAMRQLHENAEKYAIDPKRIVLAGFSAGGHLCASYCFSPAPAYAAPLPRALLLAYPAGDIPDTKANRGKIFGDYQIAKMPYREDGSLSGLPVFLWHAKDDKMVPFEQSERLDARLTREGIPHKFQVDEHGIHARPFVDDEWFGRALEWLTLAGV